MSGVRRLWHTLRWLRPGQVIGRVRFRVYRPRPDLRPAPDPRIATGRWLPCARAVSMTGPGTFRFLGSERTLDSPGDWNRADWPKLWSYNAHYFDDLVADGAPSRSAGHRALLARWMAENPPAGGIGWEPYPTSLRIVNWVKWTLAGNALPADATHCLAVQARWLRRRLEVHLLGNHLWANAKALVFAGTFFEGDEANAWRAAGLALLRRELAEQILPDGGHFERSPMYHAIVLEDLLDLVQLALRHAQVFDRVDVDRWRTTIVGMLRWLAVMSHPDGGIAFFNDAALGIAPSLAALRAYAAAIGIPAPVDALGAIEALPDSGYVRLQAGPAVVIADVGEIGPDHLPGHAHADTLSCEVSLHGRRVLVNGGTSTYETGGERLRQRGTAAHNTVVVDGQDSSEVWSSFRVARRARPVAPRWGQDDRGLWLEAGHDGYRRLPGRVGHSRRWQLSAQRLVVADRLEGRWDCAMANWLLAPAIRATCDDAFVVLSLGEPSCRLSVEGGTPGLSPASWHSGFGLDQPTQRIGIAFENAAVTITMTW